MPVSNLSLSPSPPSSSSSLQGKDRTNSSTGPSQGCQLHLGAGDEGERCSTPKELVERLDACFGENHPSVLEKVHDYLQTRGVFSEVKKVEVDEASPTSINIKFLDNGGRLLKEFSVIQESSEDSLKGLLLKRCFSAPASRSANPSGSIDHWNGFELREVNRPTSPPESTTPPKRMNIKDPHAPKPPSYADQSANDELGRYLQETLLKGVNRDGRSLRWFQPIAALCKRLGFHGVGQTNCLSCATGSG